MNTWEQATPEDYPVVVFYVVDSELPIFKRASRHKEVEPEEAQTTEMFDDLAVASSDEAAVATDKYQAHRLRLPYTIEGLQNRLARGADVPDWFKS